MHCGRPLSDDAQTNGDERFLRAHKISLGLLFAFGVQAVTFTIWLANKGAEITQLQRDVLNLASENRQIRNEMKTEHEPLLKRLEVIDQNGTRALETMRNRQNDVIAINAAQDTRIRELEGKLSEVQRQLGENKFWIDQLVRQYIQTNPLPRGAPP